MNAHSGALYLLLYNARNEIKQYVVMDFPFYSLLTYCSVDHCKLLSIATFIAFIT